MGFFGMLLSLIPGFSTIVSLAWFAIGVVYPAAMSFEAIESIGSTDDTQWLCYWVVYAVFQLVEKFTWPVLMWIPLYSVMKLGLMAWLVLPQFNGATFVYKTFARPFLFAAIDKAREVPQLEPYLRGMGSKVPSLEKKAEAVADSVQEAADDAILKAHAQ